MGEGLNSGLALTVSLSTYITSLMEALGPSNSNTHPFGLPNSSILLTLFCLDLCLSTQLRPSQVLNPTSSSSQSS